MIARAAASVVVATALVLGTAGCGFFAPQATEIHYQPSDGVAATVGDIELRNVIALSSDGTTASVTFGAINTGSDRIAVTFSVDDSSGDDVKQTLVLPAGLSTVGGGGADASLVFSGLDATVGGLLPVFVQYGSEPGKQLQVPVLDGAQEQFATLVPTSAPE
ncbi:hypothetical protein [Galbitalea sp. SE-J8]|uniref:hypothetical protein n=1 Tax=Galbitalea sp. SE-J8 TaxID=3054952 RepID=UPI00259C8EFA|nr:hypothetical protein [Galbitalea sp. SE-J8]